MKNPLFRRLFGEEALFHGTAVYSFFTMFFCKNVECFSVFCDYIGRG